MGYTFIIGNAEPYHSKEDGILSAGWAVKEIEHYDAPVFPNDGVTGKGNARRPSYSVWHDFCREVGIYNLFYDDRGHLLCGHPGCMMISNEDLGIVRSARERWQAKAALPPGFSGFPIFTGEGAWVYPDDGKYDGTLARILWLEWWMAWALENCETPAICNW